MKTPIARVLGVFATGALVALPLAGTIALCVWAASLLIRWLGPSSAIGGVLARIGLGVTGSEVVGYAIGFGIVLAAIFALGLVAEAGLQQGLNRTVRAVVTRIPLVGALYEILHKMVGMFSQRDAEGLKSMSAVWCHFGGAPRAPETGHGAAAPDAAAPGAAPGAAPAPVPAAADRVAVLGLLSTPRPVWIGGRPYLGVIVPTAPVPVGGGLLYLPADWVTPAEIGIEALTSIYVSMGVTSDQYLPSGPRDGRSPK